MSHVKLSTQAFPYPMPMAVVSSIVEGKANHMAVGWISRVNYQPPMLGIGLGKAHHTNAGIKEHREFGVGIPTASQIQAVDHVGLVSGKRVDKSAIFEIFYGELKHAPLITSCPVSMACRLVQVVDLPTNELFIGEIVEAYCHSEHMTGSSPDIEKINPFTLTMPDNRYWATGACLGKAWSIGKDYKP